MPMPPFYYQGPGPFGGHPFSQYQPGPPMPPNQVAAPDPARIKYPEITHWFRLLDEHKERNKDGIKFEPLGAVLKAKGFLRITQLTLDFVSLKDLQDWLRIEVGTAILIMQYAREDVDDIKSGKWALREEGI